MYYLIEIITFNDETKESLGMYPYATLDEAISKFHKEIGGWMLKDNVKNILCMVINQAGGVYQSEEWTAEAE